MIGNLIDAVKHVGEQPVHIDDQLVELWVWLKDMLPDWPWGNITAVGIIVGAIAFVIVFATGGRKD